MSINGINPGSPAGSSSPGQNFGIDAKIRSLEQKVQKLEREKGKALQQKNEELEKKLEKQIQELEKQIQQLKQQKKGSSEEAVSDAPEQNRAGRLPSGDEASVDTYA